MATFEQLFPTFLGKCVELHALLQVVAFLLFVVGTISFVSHGFSAKTMLLHLVRLLVLTALLVMLPEWGNRVQELLQNSVLTGLGVDPSDVHRQFNALLVVKRATGSEHSWWDILSNLGGFTIEAMVTGVLWLVAQFASFLLYWAYVFQKVILYLGYALSPLLIGLMAIRALRSVGTRYLLNLVGVLLWPLGWAVAAIVTQGILDFMTDPAFKFIDPTSGLYALQSVVGLGMAAFWIFFSTVSAPVVIQKVFSAGALAGSQMLAGAFGGFLQTAATTAGAAAVAASAGLPAVTVGAAGMAAALSTLSTAAGHGSAGAIIIAGSGLPPRSARGRPGDDITGDKAVRELIAKGRSQYY